MNKSRLIEREALVNKTQRIPKSLEGDQRLLKDKSLIPKESKKKQAIKSILLTNMTRMIRNMREDAIIVLHLHLEIITVGEMNQNVVTMIIVIQISLPTIEIGVIVEIATTRTTTQDTMTGGTEKKEKADTPTNDQETIKTETIPRRIPRIPTTTNIVIEILRNQTRRKKLHAVRMTKATVQSKKEGEPFD